MKYALITLLLATLSCAGSPPLNTPSGYPEVRTTLDRETLVEHTINGLVGCGYYVTTESKHRLVMERPSDDTTVNMFFGSQMNPIPNYRAQVTFRTVDNQEQADGRIWVVTNPGSAFEKVTDMSTGKAGQQLLSVLVMAGYDAAANVTPPTPASEPLAEGFVGPPRE